MLVDSVACRKRFAARVACVIAAVALLGATAQDKADQAEIKACWSFAGKGCDPAVGRWLPPFVMPHQPAHASVPLVRENFAAGAGPPRAFGLRGPLDGTWIVFGLAGPPQAHVAYDRAHRIAFYDVGCCSWHISVLASGVDPPPHPVKDGDLREVRTTHGIALGDSVADVIRVMGPANLIAVPGHPTLRSLSYRTAVPYPATPPPGVPSSTYGPWNVGADFVFNRGQLVQIELSADA